MALEAIEAVPILGPRPRDSHKGRFGHVLVIAGSRGMAGAAALAGAKRCDQEAPGWSVSPPRLKSSRPSPASNPPT